MMLTKSISTLKSSEIFPNSKEMKIVNLIKSYLSGNLL